MYHVIPFVSGHLFSRYVRPRHVLTPLLCHVSGQVPSCRFFGVTFPVSRLVASSCAIPCLLI